MRKTPAFLWGAATASYQVEGATRADGRGPSVWDHFCQIPGRTVNGDSGEIACDHFNRWREDVSLMRQLGLKAYRFSVAWPRVQPDGRGAVNEKGIAFYERLIDALHDAGIEPFVTLLHWDLPAALQTDLGGWLHHDLPQIFAEYAQAVFDRLGDRVRYWMTLNEPWVTVDAGYFHGVHPPALRDRAMGYRAGHNLLRAHAHAVAAYRAAKSNNGQISFAMNSSYSFPATDSPADIAAAERAVVNFAGWFTDPPYYGDYPAEMRRRLGSMLPAFSAEDSRLLKGSMDFLALNYYTSEVVRHSDTDGPMQYEVVPQPDVPHTEMNWPVRPDGFHQLLVWLNKRYPGLPFFITENGAACADRADTTGFVDDQDRIAYLRDHFGAAFKAKREGVDLRGYMVWSLIDNLEWSQGFAKRFGLIHCDRTTLKRTIKASGRWFADVIASNGSSIREGV
ncbi:MAG: beta-glucosidase [Planctomycetes bacterium]|nr:beta-glucosidase [Planctomycetota bacterium]